MGATRGQVLRVFLVQGAVVGALGSVLGLLLAVALIWCSPTSCAARWPAAVFTIALPLPMALQIALIAPRCAACWRLWPWRARRRRLTGASHPHVRRG